MGGRNIGVTFLEAKSVRGKNLKREKAQEGSHHLEGVFSKA